MFYFLCCDFCQHHEHRATGKPTGACHMDCHMMLHKTPFVTSHDKRLWPKLRCQLSFPGVWSSADSSGYLDCGGQSVCVVRHQR
jgi:hypothetical protein